MEPELPRIKLVERIVIKKFLGDVDPDDPNAEPIEVYETEREIELPQEEERGTD